MELFNSNFYSYRIFYPRAPSYFRNFYLKFKKLHRDNVNRLLKYPTEQVTANILPLKYNEVCLTVKLLKKILKNQMKL